MQNNIFKYVLIFLITIIIFCILLTAISLIPRSLLTTKTKESAEILNVQTNNYIAYIQAKNYNMCYDNYSDALMVNTAYSIDNSKPFYSAMMARKNYISGITKTIYPEEVVNLGYSSKYKKLDQIGELNDTVNNDIEESFEYARYWHGYLCILRPLLIIFNITQIRYLLLFILISLAIILLYKLYKEFDLFTAIIFLLGLWICDYFWIYNSLQSSFVFCISMIASIILIDKEIQDNRLFFMIIGMIACFCDLLTVPIVTLGIPLLVFILKNSKENYTFKYNFVNIINNCIFWAIGYFGIHFSKWLIVDILYNKNLMHISIQQFLYRTQNFGTIKQSYIQVLNTNMLPVKGALLISIIGTVILLVIKLIKNNDNLENIHFDIKTSILYLCVAFIGLAWYYVFKQHSTQHDFFTYRNFWIISTSILLGIYNLFKNVETKEVQNA